MSTSSVPNLSKLVLSTGQPRSSEKFPLKVGVEDLRQLDMEMNLVDRLNAPKAERDLLVRDMGGDKDTVCLFHSLAYLAPYGTIQGAGPEQKKGERVNGLQLRRNVLGYMAKDPEWWMRENNDRNAANIQKAKNEYNQNNEDLTDMDAKSEMEAYASYMGGEKDDIVPPAGKLELDAAAEYLNAVIITISIAKTLPDSTVSENTKFASVVDVSHPTKKDANGDLLRNPNGSYVELEPTEVKNLPVYLLLQHHPFLKNDKGKFVTDGKGKKIRGPRRFNPLKLIPYKNARRTSLTSEQEVAEMFTRRETDRETQEALLAYYKTLQTIHSTRRDRHTVPAKRPSQKGSMDSKDDPSKRPKQTVTPVDPTMTPADLAKRDTEIIEQLARLGVEKEVVDESTSEERERLLDAVMMSIAASGNWENYVQNPTTGVWERPPA